VGKNKGQIFRKVLDGIQLLQRKLDANVAYIRYTSPMLVGKGYLFFFIWPTQ